MDIFRFFLDKLVFPKIVTHSEPGIIESRVATKFGTVRARRRIVTFWESVVAAVEDAAADELGDDAGQELMYRAGKRQGVRYLLFGNRPIPAAFRKPALEYFFAALRAGGFRVAENVAIDLDARSLTIHGGGNVICRRTGGGAIFAGFVAGILSMVLDEEIEAVKTRCVGRGDDRCEIIAFPRGDERTRFTTDRDLDVGPRESYVRDNFGTPASTRERLPSYKDLVRSGKVVMEPDTGRILLGGERLFQFECGGPGIIVDEFRRAGQEDLVHRTISSAARELGGTLLGGHEDASKRLGLLRTLLSGLAYGVPLFSRSSDTVEVTVLSPPVSRFGPLWQVWELEGFLSAALDRRMVTDRVTEGAGRLKVAYHFT